uniref:Uncharacterized protein n=1 Tax=Desulfobacca acetoxidans TaxID=60893 RepID=A0A7C3UZ13_9BACT
MLSKDYYQDVLLAVKDSADALMIDHNPKRALGKALQAAAQLNRLIEELKDLKAGYPKEVWGEMA